MLAQAEEELPLPGVRPGDHRRAARHAPARREGTVQAAAIVGKVFWPGALGELRSISIAARVEQCGCTRSSARSSCAESAAPRLPARPPTSFATCSFATSPTARFRAHGGRTCTGCAAGWVESLAGDRPEDLADMVAHHYLSALDLDRRIEAREDPELAARARTRASSTRATASSALNAFAAAARFYEQALELWHGERRRQATRPPRLRTGSLPRRGRRKGRLARGGRRIPRRGRKGAGSAWPWSLWRTSFISSKGIARKRARNLDLAVSLVEDAPPSPVKAGVLANRARFHMISDETDQAIRLADEALALATRLELEDLQAHTLNTRGVARTLNGDFGGVEDLERAVEIAPPLSFELMRALNNLVSTLVELGDLERGFALDGRGPSRRRADTDMSLRWRGSRRSSSTGSTGSVSGTSLLSRAERMLDETSSTTPTLMAIDAYIFRARVRLAKGNVARLRSRTRRRLLEFARAQGDPQVAFPALATRAQVLHEAGQHAEATDAGRRAPRTLAGEPNICGGPLARRGRTCAGRARARHRARAGKLCVYACGRGGSAPPQASRGRRCRSGRRASTTEIGRARRRGEDTPARRRAARWRGSARGGREPARARARVLPPAGAERYVRAAEALLAVS